MSGAVFLRFMILWAGVLCLVPSSVLALAGHVDDSNRQAVGALLAVGLLLLLAVGVHGVAAAHARRGEGGA